MPKTASPANNSMQRTALRAAALAARTVPSGGHLILATFAFGGPTRCSGLDVCRYDGHSASAELSNDFRLVRECDETHVTPAGKPQQFFYGVFEKV